MSPRLRAACDGLLVGIDATGSAKSSGDDEDHSGRSGLRALRRSAAAMLVAPVRRRMLMDEVAQGCHDLGSCTGADLGMVFGEGHIAHPVQAVLDLPWAAEPGGELGGPRLVGAQVSDRVDGLGVPPAASGCWAGAAV